MKRIVIKTVYYNCSDEMVENYINELCHNGAALKEQKDKFLAGETVNIKSEDPDSDAFGITTYNLEQQP